MFTRLGNGITRHPWTFVITWIILLGLAAVGAFWGFGQGGLFERMQNSESLVAGSESDRVQQEITGGDQGSKVTIVVKDVDLNDQSTVVKTVSFLTAHRTDLKLDNIESVVDPFLFANPKQDPRSLALTSSDGTGFVIAISLKDGLDDQETTDTIDNLNDAIETFKTDLSDAVPGASSYVLSSKIIGNEIIDQVHNDLIRGETVGLPIALLLLIIVFGGVIAAGLPLFGAIISIVVGMAMLWGLTFAIGIDSFILNVVSIIGLALSIDYGLLVVSRYREEVIGRLVAAGYPADLSALPERSEANSIIREAVRHTVSTAGRTISFSALTIACAISGLTIMESEILRVIAAGGIIVTLLAVFTAVSLVPALIVLFGRKLLKPSIITRIPVLRSVTKAVGDSTSSVGFFSRLASWVHRHPWPIIIIVVGVLGAMSAPICGLKLRSNFSEYIPVGSEVSVAYDTLQDNYVALATPTITIVADAPPASAASLVPYLKNLGAVTYVSQPTPTHDDDQRSIITVLTDFDDPVGVQATDLVVELRDYDPGYEILVGGPAALQYDFTQSIKHDAPFSALIIVIAVFVLLFLMTGSLIVPFKALLINIFSLIASLGATVWIFEHGYLGMPKVPGLEGFIVACMAAFGFGLAMDYEVFLLARIKEYWDKGLANDEAVEQGLQRSGRIITSAAAIIIAVFLGFVSGDMIAIKQIGVALAITVVTDATLVRMLLVPATMTILGKWNWWAPKPMRWIYEKFKIVH